MASGLNQLVACRWLTHASGTRRQHLRMRSACGPTVGLLFEPYLPGSSADTWARAATAPAPAGAAPSALQPCPAVDQPQGETSSSAPGTQKPFYTYALGPCRSLMLQPCAAGPASGPGKQLSLYRHTSKDSFRINDMLQRRHLRARYARPGTVTAQHQHKAFMAHDRPLRLRFGHIACNAR
jgi:hypothetical protein